MKTVKDETARKFLLGKLSEEEQIKIEEGYFSDKKLFEEILIAENDLIDAYAAGNLSSEDKSRFEIRLLLNPQQRQRVQFAKTLVKYVSNQSFTAENSVSVSAKSFWTSISSWLVSNKPILSFAFVTAVLIFFAGIWLTFDKQNHQDSQIDELAAIQTPQQDLVQEKPTETSESNKIIEERKPETSPSPHKSNQQKMPQTKQETLQKKEKPIIFSLILSPGLTRDSGTNRIITIPAKTDFVRMQLKFEEDNFSSYRAILETVEGTQIWSSSQLKSGKDSKSVEVLIPSKVLKKADYILSLKGFTKDGIFERAEDYAFTINR